MTTFSRRIRGLSKALKKRGITDLRLVTCYTTPAGHVDLPEQTEGRRIGWGGCTYTANAKYGWDREVPGIFFVVDMNEKKIVRFSDYGGAPMSPTTSIYDADGGPALAGTKPIVTMQPDGPSFTIKDGEVSWQKWHFRFRLDRARPTHNTRRSFPAPSDNVTPRFQAASPAPRRFAQKSVRSTVSER